MMTNWEIKDEMSAPLVLWFSLILLFRPVPLVQIRAFLAQDITNLHQYGDGYYCSDFSADLVHNAKMQGIEAESIGILFTHEIGHAIVRFQTTDNGIIYVEPQTDAIYPIIQVGQIACAANFCPGNGEVIRKIIVN